MDIGVYFQQFESQCEASSSNLKKRVSFFANLTHKLFTTLKDLWAPEKVHEQPYDKIKEILLQQFSYKRTEL